MAADGGGGFDTFIEGFVAGLTPDPELWLDRWSEEHMVLPRETAAEHGRYKADRTVGAREVLRWLSPAHPCIRIVVVGPSQFMKTQIALNAICGWIDSAPGNILALEPTLTLAKRLSGRLAKTIAAIDTLNEKVAQPRSRDARNTLDTKEFDGGALYITTAGSASNLAELPVRYLFVDEVDRMEDDLDGEGDPSKLAENRTTTYRYNRKMYYASSPVRTGVSRIMRLYEQGTQNVVVVPCPHCDTYHELRQENLHHNDELTHAWMRCPACAAVIEEHHKAMMFAAYRLSAQSDGDGETQSLHVSSFYAPPGRITWLDMAKEHAAAEAALEVGGKDPHALMQVYYNTRLALPYSTSVEVADPVELAKRAEDYPECTVPRRGLVLTAGVDVQHDRLAIIIRAWGRGAESWLVYWGEIHGQTLVPGQGAWIDLENFLHRPFRHESGAEMLIKAYSVDSGDGASQEAVYAYARKWKHRGVMATKGASEKAQKKHEIFTPPKPSIDVDRKQKAWKYGIRVYFVGTHAAKNLILKVQLPLEGSGPNRMHWYASVRGDYWEQITSEVEVPGKGRGVMVWETKAGVRNEGLDCEVLALHASRSLKIHLIGESVWASLEDGLRQAALFAPAEEIEQHDPELIDESNDQPASASVSHAKNEPTLAPLPAPALPPQPVQQEASWLDDHENWLN